MTRLFSKFFYSISVFRNPFESFLFFKNLIRYRKAKNHTDSSSTSYKMLINGHKVDLNLRTYSGDIDIFYEIFWEQCYKIPKSLKIEQYRTIVDLGANVGLASVYFKTLHPNAKIYSVEMEPKNYQQLTTNISQFKNATHIFGAIYDEHKTIAISNTELAYNFKVAESDQFSETSITIPVLTMDDLIANHHIEEIDLLKIDIEGAEARILRYNNGWLSKVKSILIELHDPYTIEDLKKDLAPFNFEIYTPKQNTELKMIYAIKR